MCIADFGILGGVSYRILIGKYAKLFYRRMGTKWIYIAHNITLIVLAKNSHQNVFLSFNFSVNLTTTPSISVFIKIIVV